MLTREPSIRGNAHAATALVAAGLLAGGASACDTPAEDTQSQTSALTSSDFRDPGGAMTVRIKTCDWSAVAHRPTAFCQVDPAFVLIGGGAEVEGSTPNALLTGSIPVNDLTTWFASSKDHLVSYPHRLRAYSIGLMMDGVDVNNLRSAMRHVEVTSAPAQHPTATVKVRLGSLAIGGGVWVNYSSDPGALLTESFSPFDPNHPEDRSRWTGSAKDHGIGQFNTIQVAAIDMPICVNTICFIPRIDSGSQFVSTGFSSASVATPGGFILASVGGQAQYNGSGRLLTKLVPFTPNGLPGAQVQSKDHSFASSGSTTAFAFSVKTYFF